MKKSWGVLSGIEKVGRAAMVQLFQSEPKYCYQQAGALLPIHLLPTQQIHICTKGSHHIRKTVKKADNVRFGRPPPKRVKSGHLLSEKSA